MKLQILGVGGTFMAGLAIIAREAGHEVSGMDAGVYPPMSTQLQDQDIQWTEGYAPEDLDGAVDCVIVGNALSRGQPVVERMLNEDLAYRSGPEWLAREVLRGRRVVAIAGTHGKTTTTSMLAWILDEAGQAPGFLIGGIPGNFGVSARLGAGEWFVIEADEYDTAFFDKRAKFVHYRPQVLVLNNLEFDHADIYPDLAAIQRQFHHLVRTVPGSGRIISNAGEPALHEVLAMGCWTPVQRFAIGDSETAEWRVTDVAEDGSEFGIVHKGVIVARVSWDLCGYHNVANGLAAVAAAHALAVAPEQAASALARFSNVSRRLELVIRAGGIAVYDDFAHHPTEIRSTIAGLKARVGDERVVAVFEPRSNSMRMGAHAPQELANAFSAADRAVVVGREDLKWDPGRLVNALGERGRLVRDMEQLLGRLREETRPGDHVVFLSNGSFDGAPARFARALKAEE